MKKKLLSVALLATSVLFAGCGTSSQALLSGLAGNAHSQGATTGGATSQQSESSLGTALGSLLGSFLGNSIPFSQSTILGSWNYQGADCIFESDNFLMKAGGEVAAAQVESKINNALAKVGISAGKCTFTFNKDNTYTATIGSRAISGTYTLDTENKKITLTYLQGLGQMTPQIVMNGGKLSLLFEADKLLKLLSTVSALGGSTSMKTVSNLLTSYDGLLIGMQFQK